MHPRATALRGVGVALALTCLPGAGPAMTHEVPPARDGNIAIQEEFCAARAKATVEAYDLFIARHPKHALAAKAKEERARLGQKGHAPHTPDCPPPMNRR